MNVTLPNGTKITGIPEGTPPEAIKQAAIRKGLATHMDFGVAEYGSPVSESGVENVLAGAGKAFMDTGRGMADIVTDYLPGAGGANEAVERGISESRRLDAPLMGTKAGMGGNVAGNIALMAPTMAIPGVNTIRGAALMGAGMGAVQPTVGDESRMVNTASGAALGAAGQKGANLLGQRFAGATGRMGRRQAENQVRNETVRMAREAGYKLPPVQTNPRNVVNQALEGVSGKLMTEKVASSRNVSVTNRLARRALGLADDAPLTETVLKNIRREAGKAYAAVTKGLKEVISDKQYMDDIAKGFDEYTDLINEFPQMSNSGVDDLIEMVSREKFSSKNLMRLMRQLRRDAKTNFKGHDDPKKLGLAKAQLAIADALESLVERNLEKAGKSGLMAEFRAARQRIAKAYNVDAALNASGDVNPQIIAAQLGRGIPLSDELLTIGRSAQLFPKAIRPMNESVNNWTLPTIGFGAMGAAAGSPAMMGLAASRPFIRESLLSAPYQKLMGGPSYNPYIQQAAGKLLQSEPGQHLGRALLPGLMGAARGPYSD